MSRYRILGLIGLLTLSTAAAAQAIILPHEKPKPTAPTPPPNTQPQCPSGHYDTAGNCLPWYYHRRRPVIIQQQAAPAEPAVTEPPTADREGCRQSKIKQLNALKSGDTDRANKLDEWLWKNCRYYSDELRDIEQDNM